MWWRLGTFLIGSHGWSANDLVATYNCHVTSRPPFLLWMELLRAEVPSYSKYPFSLPVIQSMDRITFHPRVTFLVGENGSGKSTLLEAIAVAWGFNPEGGSKNFRFSTRASQSGLSDYIRLAKSPSRARDGYFLRAESFFNVATSIEAMDAEPAPAPPIASAYGERPLHEQSHGESFLALLCNRFRGQGLYILDEPEAALSPTRQLAALGRIHDLVEQGSQFLIATHSPILLAYPEAEILQIEDGQVAPVAYVDTDHYIFCKRFFSNHRAAVDKALLTSRPNTSEDQGPDLDIV
jgi:predicted ATPase